MPKNGCWQQSEVIWRETENGRFSDYLKIKICNKKELVSTYIPAILVCKTSLKQTNWDNPLIDICDCLVYIYLRPSIAGMLPESHCGDEQYGRIGLSSWLPYIFEGYQQQPIAITQCFSVSQSSYGSTIQYLSVLKTKIHESWLQCVTNFKHEY